MNRRALVLTKSRSGQPAASAGGVDLSSAPPASNLLGHSVAEAAIFFHVDPSTIRRDIQRGAPVLIRGARGPGRGARLDLHAVEQWRGRASGPVGLTTDEAVQRISAALLASLIEHSVDVRAGITRQDAAAALIVVWEACCTAFAVTFKFDAQPEAIRAILREL